MVIYMHTYQHYIIPKSISFVLELSNTNQRLPHLRSSLNEINKHIILTTQSTVQTSCMSQEGGWVYTQISSLFISSTQAVGKHLEPQHGSRHECCAITHQDTSHRCGKCVTPTLILLASANTAPDSTRPHTAHSAWSTSDYTKLGSGTSTLYIKKKFKKKISRETKVLCFCLMVWKTCQNVLYKQQHGTD